MDVGWFLRERIRLIRFTFEQAASPFTNMKQQIENCLPPYDDPPSSDDLEPSFMAEWSDANTALGIIGRSFISILSASLKLYFDTWEKELGVQWKNREKVKAMRRGFAEGYLAKLCDTLGINLSECPADLAIIEQVFLARNRDQHPENIHSMNVAHSLSDLAKHPNPFFMSEYERAMYADGEFAEISFMSPSVHVDAEMLHGATVEAETLVNWLDSQFFAVKYPGSAKSKT